MVRMQSVHVRSESEYLDHAIKRLENDQELVMRAEATLAGFAAQEPLIRASLATPQDALVHSEGPFMDAHLKRMLIVLYGLAQEKLHLIDIEELRRMKPYEGEIDELEEVFKEKFAFFEVFILVHDVAKLHTIEFASPPESRGAHNAFVPHSVLDPVQDQAHRQKLLERYAVLFAHSRKERPHLSDRVLQQEFFEQFEIRIQYPHHDRLMYAPLQQELISRVSAAHDLSDVDASMLGEIVGRHLEFGVFHNVRPSAVGWLSHLAVTHGFDADVFLHLVEGCVFLDWVVGSQRVEDDRVYHDARYLTNLLMSEHQFSPEQRVQKNSEREQRKRADRNRLFQQVGLDGEGLMLLLQMKPGRELGSTLKEIQKAVVGDGKMPKFAPTVEKEIEKRVAAFYHHYFEKGD